MEQINTEIAPSIPTLAEKLSAKRSDFEAAKANGQCGFCGRVKRVGEDSFNLMMCNSCKKVHYCDRKCQKKHWKAHKPICKSVTAIENDVTENVASTEDGAPSSVPKDWSSFKATQECLLDGLICGLVVMESLDPKEYVTVAMSEYNPTTPNPAAKFHIFDAFSYPKPDVLSYVDPVTASRIEEELQKETKVEQPCILLNVAYYPAGETACLLYTSMMEEEPEEKRQEVKAMHVVVREGAPELSPINITRQATFSGRVFTNDGFKEWEEGTEVVSIEKWAEDKIPANCAVS